MEFNDEKLLAVQKGYESILSAIHPEWQNDQHLKDTPMRAAKAALEMCDGYEYDDSKINTSFDVEKPDGVVVVRDIKYHTQCAHHLLPFNGKVHIAYLPDKKILGLSKFARIVRKFSRRFQIQEELTKQIADEVQKLLEPRGVFVYVDGTHMCMQMRGVESQGGLTVTTSAKGLFIDDQAAKAEVFKMMGS